MEKKIITQGTERNRSYTITLPMKWVKNNRLDKTLKVNVEVANNRLMVSASRLMESKIKIDATNLAFIIKKLLGEKYKLGVDEVELIFEDAKIGDMIKEYVQGALMGFEIFEESKDRLVIRDISKETVEDFEKTLRRCFHLLLVIGEDTEEAVRKNDVKYAERVVRKDRDLNRLVFFSGRQLSKRSQEYYGKIQFYFSLLERIENIGDTYKGMCAFFVESGKPLKKETINIVAELNRKLREFVEIFYSHKSSYKAVKDYFEDVRKVRLKVLQLYTHKNADVRYLYYIGGTFQILNGMVKVLYTLKEVG